MSRLAEFAQRLITPDQAVSTGWPKVRDTCNNLGWGFDDWQDDLGRLMLSKRADGLYAPSICALSMPRQVGKTYLVGCIAFAVCLTQPGTTVIWTAHRARLATETFRAMKAKAKVPELAAFIDQRVKGGGIRSSNGEQEIEFLNGSRIMFGAREAGFGVGFTNVGMLVLDEVQRATTRTMDDMLPATNAAANPLVLCMGTPPRPTDDGEVFTMLRTEALSGESDDVLYVELGAGQQFDVTNDTEFWRQLRLANPSFPHRVGERAILRNKKGLSEESVLREVFGVWDDVGADRALDQEQWRRGVDPDSAPEMVAAFGIEVALGRKSAAIGTAGIRPDGLPHLEVIENRPDTRWLVDRCVELDQVHGPAPFIVDGGGPAGSFAEELDACGLEVIVLTSRDVGHACAWVVDANREGLLRHGPQPELDAAAAGAKLRDIGDGMSAFGRRVSTVNIGPLVAVTLAAHVLPSSLPLDQVTAAFM